MVPLPRLMPLLRASENPPNSTAGYEESRLSADQIQFSESRPSTTKVDAAQLRSPANDALFESPKPIGSAERHTAANSSETVADRNANVLMDRAKLAQVERSAVRDFSGGVAAVSATTGFRFLKLALEIYLAIGIVAAGWLLVGHVVLIVERFMAKSPPTWLFRLLQSVAADRRGQPPQLLISLRCRRPVAWGIWRPVVMLPEPLCRIQNRAQLKSVLLHELSHIRRGDAWGNLLFEMAIPLLFGHPLFWWLRAQSRMSSELIADDWAALHAGKETYVSELVALARSSAARWLPMASATSVLSSQSQFYRRMKMLLSRETPLVTKVSRFWKIGSLVGLSVSVAIASALVGVGPAVGQQPAAPIAPVPLSTPATIAASPAGSNNAASSAPVPVATPAAEGAATTASGNYAAPAVEPANALPSTATTAAAPQTPSPAVGTPATPGNAPIARWSVLQLTQTTPSADEASIDAEIRKLQEEIKLLQLKSAALRAYSTFAQSGSVAKAQTVAEPPRNSAAPQNRIEPSQAAESALPSPAPMAEPTPAYRVPKEIRTVRIVKDNAGDGAGKVLQTYELTPDNRLGKLIESHPLVGNPFGRDEESPAPQAPGVRGLALPITEDPSLTAARPLDLVALATSYADAVGAVDQAKAKLSEAERIAAKSESEAEEVASAKVTLQSAERKAALLRRIAEIATASARQTLKRSESLHASGAFSGESLADVQSRVEILEHILNLGQSGSASDTGESGAAATRRDR
jgi:beta-lactamase regulating signal transducer with metallopeptidase domain